MVGAVVTAVLTVPNPPKDVPVVFWLGATWPNANTFCFAASGSGCVVPNVKEPLLELEVAARGAGAGAVTTAAGVAVVVVGPNGNELPALGTSTGTELVLAVVGVVQLPKSDFKVGWLAFCVEVTELVEVVPMGVLVMLENMDGATVVLLMEPNTDDVMLEESVEAGFVAVMGED